MMRTQNHHLNHNHNRDEDEQSRVFYELSSLVLSLIRSPNSSISSLSDHHHHHPNRSQISPSGFASLLLGMSCALMLCGSVTFFIGFILMPWVIGFLLLFYFVGMLSYISMLGRAIFYQATSSVSSPKEIPSWKLL